MSYIYRFNIDQYRRIAGDIARRYGAKPVTVFEIGSRDAADAFLLSSLLPKDSRIVCFDPHPLFRKLSAPFAATQLVVIENVALSETSGARTFYMTNTEDLAASCDDLGIGASSLKKPISNVSGLPTTGFVEVTATCLRGDEYCAAGNLAPDVLILDVQGAEVEVLKSFGNRLESVGLVFTECNLRSGVTYEGDSAAADVISFLRSKGFALFSAYNISRYSADLIFSKGGGGFAAHLWARIKLVTLSGARNLLARLR